VSKATDLVLRVLRLFDELGIGYMLVGSFSSNYYGKPRSTQDADILVVVSDEQLEKLRGALLPDFRLDAPMSFETVTMTTRHLIMHPASAFKFELFLLSQDPHDQERFKRRQQVGFEGHSAWLPTPEDVIIQKLRWAKEGGPMRGKDLDDVQKVLAVQRGKLDLGYIRRWVDQHGTRSVFEQLLAAAG